MISFINIFIHSVVDILVDFGPMCPGFESRESHDFFYLFIYLFFMFFFVIIITVQICKFNNTVATQFLLLYYSLWCPGLQRLQRFDFFLRSEFSVNLKQIKLILSTVIKSYFHLIFFNSDEYALYFFTVANRDSFDSLGLNFFPKRSGMHRSCLTLRYGRTHVK